VHLTVTPLQPSKISVDGKIILNIGKGVTSIAIVATCCSPDITIDGICVFAARGFNNVLVISVMHWHNMWKEGNESKTIRN
jgi:hypothetical protein